MQAKKLTLIGALAVSVAVAGCSDSGVNSISNPDEANFNKVSMPSYEDNQETIDRAEPVRSRAELTASVFEAETAKKHMGLTVTVLRIEIEGGCWYLKTKKGNTFEPLFGKDAPKLFEGMRLKISGYVDTEIPTICQIAPVFRIEKFEILQPAGDALIRSDEKMDEETDVFVLYPPKAPELRNTNAKKRPVVSVDADNRINLKGIYGVVEKGCRFLKINGGEVVELNFLQSLNPKIKENTLIKVSGHYSLRTGSRCQLGPIFNVVYFDTI